MEQSEEDERSCMRALGWEDRFSRSSETARGKSKRTLEGSSRLSLRCESCPCLSCTAMEKRMEGGD
jgi:hypothetical protein